MTLVPTEICGSDGGDIPVFFSKSATQARVLIASVSKSCVAGSVSRKQVSKYGYLLSVPQPKDERSDLAAVMMRRLGAASAGTKTPEKQAEMKTTVGRSEHELSISSLSFSGLKSFARTTPSGEPCELK